LVGSLPRSNRDAVSIASQPDPGQAQQKTGDGTLGNGLAEHQESPDRGHRRRQVNQAGHARRRGAGQTRPIEPVGRQHREGSVTTRPRDALVAGVAPSSE